MKNNFSAKTTVKKLDIFALPFQFTFGRNEKEKKTFVGGILTLIILGLSLAYFIYLCYLYFANQLQPSIAQTNEYSQTPYKMQIDKNFISIKMVMYNGQTLQEFQKSKGQVYLHLLSVYQAEPVNFQKVKYIPMMKCEDEDLDGYMCFDIQNLIGNIEDFYLHYTPGNIEKNSIYIMLTQCDPKYLAQGEVCANQADINKDLINYGTQITLRLSLTQYNTKIKQYEKRIKQESFYFDPNLAFFTKFNLQKSDFTLNEGLIIQSSTENTFFSDYVRKDNYSTLTYVQSQMQLPVIGAQVFFIGQESVSHYIQYPQFTSLLAQFTSVFNSLLFLGIFSKMLAQSEIVQQIIELKLKVYFKQTGLYLIEQYGNQKEFKEAKKQGTFGLWNYLQSLDYQQSINKNISISFLKKLKILFLGGRGEEEKNKQNENKIDHLKIFKSLIDISDDALNVFSIQKEIMEIKLMLRLILSVEQYAAMQLCGSRVPICVGLEKKLSSIKQPEEQEVIENEGSFKKIDFFSQENVTVVQKNATVYPLSQLEGDQIVDKNESQENIQMTHLEKIDLIERDKQFFQNSIDKFIQNNQPNSEIDKRILECMIGVRVKNRKDNNSKF